MKNTPRVLGHVSALKEGSLVISDRILTRDGDRVYALSRICPHRNYLIGETGEILQNIKCKLHCFEYNCDGSPKNSDLTLPRQDVVVGKSGLLYLNWTEPETTWADILSEEKLLVYSHTTIGTSEASWLWMMEIHADLLHVQKTGIHPELSAIVDLEEIQMEAGDGWARQFDNEKLWLCVYPLTFIEWAKGCLVIIAVTPTNQSEFGFTWTNQYYYHPLVLGDRKAEFELADPTFHQDVAAIEKQQGPYSPLKKAVNRYEDHCVHFGNWVTNNK